MNIQDLLSNNVQFGMMTGFGTPKAARLIVDFAHKHGFDSLWVGDHVAFPVPIIDCLTQLTYAAALSTRLTIGTAVYLLPLRHPTPVAKQISSLDMLSDGRLIFGVGIGGEFPNEYAACGVDVKQRGARLGESVKVLRKLWSGEPVSFEGNYFNLNNVRMRPVPKQSGGPPIWFGARQPAALARAGRLADGYISYIVTPSMFADALNRIADSAEQANRKISQFGTGHLLFARIDDDYESAFKIANSHLSQRYAMDFSKATRKYAAIGKPSDVAAKIAQFHDAGVRHFVLDMVGPETDRLDQLERFVGEVKTLFGASISASA